MQCIPVVQTCTLCTLHSTNFGGTAVAGLRSQDRQAMRQRCRLFLDESLMRRFYLTVSLIKHIFKTYSLFLIKLHTSRPTRLAGSLRADRRGGPKSRREPQVYMYHRTIFEHLLLRNSVSHKLPLSSSKLLLNLLRETLDNI